MVITFQQRQAWDIGQAIPLGSGLDDGLKWAPLLDQENGSVTAALEILNRDMPHLDGDCYICFSTSCLKYFLLYRHGSHDKVLQKLAESLQSASKEMKWERSTSAGWERSTTAGSSADPSMFQEEILQAHQRATLEARRAENLATELQAAKREIAELRHRLQQTRPTQKMDVNSSRKDPGSMSGRELPNSCMAGMHDNKNEFAVEFAIALGPCQPEASDLPGATFLDSTSVTSLRAAVARLNSGELVCHGDLAVAWGASAMGYYLLYRRGCKQAAQQCVCVMAENLSSSFMAGLLPRELHVCQKDLSSRSVRTHGDLPNSCVAGMHANKNEWAVELAIALGPCQPEASDLPGAIFLDSTSVTSLRAAAAQLNSGELVCHGDLAVAWGASAMGYYLLYRRGCMQAAQQCVCLMAEHLSSFMAGLLPRELHVCQKDLSSRSVRTQADLPNLCMAGMHANKNEWAFELAISLGPCQPEASDLPGAIFLDSTSVTSLRSAVAKLNAGELVCHGDLAVAWSEASMGYHLLYRRGCKETAQQSVCVMAEHLSSLKASRLERDLAPTTATPREP
ncbi:unnamed protein product [Polarella glacialis]|uniref:Uncharacterized protein n=1 Tax=Polarella glacialis TaxID=89957 RepID=A0A813I2G6_POLGL|nr:unnamed protein product [Polarella glacialis]